MIRQVLAGLGAIGVVLSASIQAVAVIRDVPISPETPVTQPDASAEDQILQACPTELEAIVDRLLRDLPSYANRVAQRSINPLRSREMSGYLLIAGQPDYRPLPLAPGEVAPSPAEADPTQLFFTTLERQYVNGEAVLLQHYHWVFLTQTDRGWRLALMQSTLGEVPPDEPPTPPEDTSNGVIAQAIRLWLRDCEAGGLLP